MAEKQNTPEIRFEGFNDPWEQRKFADFVSASGIRNSENLELPSYSVTNDCGFVPQDERFENGGTMREADKTSYWIVEPKSFAYNPARINVGSIGYQSTSGNVIVSSLYEVFQTDETCDDRFLWHWFKTRLFTQQIEMLQEGGVRLYFFFDKLLKSGISMPSVDEQRLIGEQFDWLDSLITLHQRKYDKLCTVKKSMLDKMFPKPGETEPEIRFEGFNNPWEQRKWSEYVSISTDMVDPRSGNYDNLPHVGPGNMESFTGRLYDNVNTVKDDALISGKFHFDPGDIIYGKINPQLGKYTYAQFEGLASADAYVLNGKNGLTQEFLFGILQTKAFFDYSVSVSMRSGMPKINRDELNAFEFLAPNESEQRAIGDILLKLDDLITLHQRKLELLRNIKKSLLDRMFV